MKTRHEIFFNIINKDLYQFLRSKNADELNKATKNLRLFPSEIDFVFSLHQEAKIASKETFEKKIEQAASKYGVVFPFKLDYQADQEVGSVEKKFSKYLENKRVVVVGPSSTVVGENQGKEIESFDVVVRLNFQWPVADELVKDIGSRMDVLYHCCNADYFISDMFVEEFSQTKFACFQNNIDSRILRFYCKNKNIPVLDVSAEYEKLNNNLQVEINTGLVAINHLLKYPLKELGIYGITFYQTPYYFGYKGHGVDGDLEGNMKASLMQLKYFVDLLKMDPRIRPDITLKKIISNKNS